MSLNETIEGAGNFTYHYPALATIVTVDTGTERNAMAVAWHSSISFMPPLYGISISRKRHTYPLMVKAQEFSINFMSFESAKLVQAVGGCSGRNVNKFERFKIETIEPLKIKSPVLKDAYAAYECKLVERRTMGDHDWFVGEVLATHFDKDHFEGGILKGEQVQPSLYMGRDTYLLPETSRMVPLDRKGCVDELGQVAKE